VPAEQVALHEVGAADAMVDIVGALEGFEHLGVNRVYNWPVTVGAGWVRAAHGVIPVPAPATAVLLEGIELGPNGPVTGEATTPTGAVLLRVLSSGPPPARWRPVSAGSWGAGGRNPSAYPNALRLMSTTLTQLGYSTRCEQDGAAALGAARATPPSAIVLDLIMPGMSGFEFLEQLRRDPAGRRVPVIVWTGKDLSLDERAQLRASANAVVAKDPTGGHAVVAELAAFLPSRAGVA